MSTTLAEWQSFARSTGLRGWSRLKKDELVDFLLDNLWWGGGSDGPRGREARWSIRKHRKKNPLDEKNPKIGVPVLIPEKSEFPQKAIPKVIEQNVEIVVDWLNWLESVKEEEKELEKRN